MTKSEGNVPAILTTSVQKGDKFKTFLKRALSTLILIAVLAGVYYLKNVWVYVVVFSAFCFIASWEWVDMLKHAKINSPRWLVIGAGTLYPLLLGTSLIMGGKCIISPYFVICVAPAIVTIIAFLWELQKPVDGKETLLNITGSVVSFIYPVWMFSFALLLLVAPLYDSFGERIIDGTHRYNLNNSVTFFFVVFLMTKITDIGAYIVGSLIGKHKMIPHISPGKTWEGFLGAILITFVLGYVFLGLVPDKYYSGNEVNFYIGFSLLILLIALLSVVGDLAGSLIKRALDVKDSGKLLPGIGGVFDLIDSPAFTFPAFIFLTQVFHFS